MQALIDGFLTLFSFGTFPVRKCTLPKSDTEALKLDWRKLEEDFKRIAHESYQNRKATERS